MVRHPAISTALMFCCAAELAAAGEPVRVVVDMDAATPGLQGHVAIPASQTVVQNVAIHIFDPLATRTLWGIGYIGGLDRGIGFGHMPDAHNAGSVASLVPSPGVPANPGNSQELLSPAHQPGFDGPEVQYLEWGASQPALLRGAPDAPVFTVDIVLSGAQPGDVFDFYLLDMVTVWSGGSGGAFSVESPMSLDAGGDAVLDGTQTQYGADPDAGLAAPPAPYRVDYVDGGNNTGPATITTLPATGIDPSSLPASLALHRSRPHPFRERATIGFDLPAPARVRLGVFDANGRLLRRLVDEASFPGGRHATEWDGRDAAGRPAPTGVYFVSLESDRETRSQRLVRLP